MNGIRVLNLKFNIEGTQIKVHPALIFDDQERILVDCGYFEALPQIQKGMLEQGLPPKTLTRVIITHHDHDHMGSLKELVDCYPDIEVLSSKIQIPYITGERRSLRLEQAEERHPTLSDKEKEWSLGFQAMIASVQTIPFATGVETGEVLPWCGGIEVVDTAGHMPGHISLYVRAEKTLIAGDALVLERGRLHLPYPQYCFDFLQAKESAKRLLDYDIERIICYHGGICTEDIPEQLRRVSS